MEVSYIKKIASLMTVLIVLSVCIAAAPRVMSYDLIVSTTVAPAKVTLYAPFNITQNTVTLNWSPSGEADFKRYDVMVSITPGGTSSTCSCTIATTAPVTLNEANMTTAVVLKYNHGTLSLQSGKTYFFAIKVIDNEGQSSLSNEVSATMPSLPADVTPPEITIFSPENLTYYSPSIQVNWTSNETYAWAGYSLNGSPAISITESLFTISGLPNGTCSLTIFANDSSKNMGSATVWFNTYIDSEPPSIMMLYAPTTTEEEGSRVTIDALITDDLGVNGTYLFWRLDGSSLFTQVSLVKCPVCADKYEYNMTLPTGIDTFVEYYVLASDGRNNATSPWNAPAALYNITVNARPLPVNIISPINATSSSATLTWVPSTAADFQMYSIYSSQNASQMVPVVNLTSVNASSFTLTGLSANTTYYFLMRVYDSGSLYRDSALASVTTLPAPQVQEQPPYALYAGIGVVVVVVVAAAYLFLRKK